MLATVLVLVSGILGASPALTWSNTATTGGPVERARAAVAEAEGIQEEAEAAVAAAQGVVDRVDAKRRLLGAAEQAAAAEIEKAMAEARLAAIETYISGGPSSTLHYLLDATEASDLTFRNYLARQQVRNLDELARDYQRIRDGADRRVLALADQITQADGRLADAQTALERAQANVASARAALADAETRAARLAAALAQRPSTPDAEIAAPRPTQPSPGNDPGDNAGGPVDPRPDPDPGAGGGLRMPSAEQWRQLRVCESGDNYRAVSSSGRYRGAYQFSIRTWESVGGRGDPIDAPPAEQDARAQALYRLSGASPWPHCGRHVRPPQGPVV